MTKFSDFIRAPGTAGPPTREGILALGFALRSEITVELSNFVRVDEAQTFLALEQEQGRENIDAQQFSASLTSIAGLTTAANQIAYTTGADTWATTALTAFARTILDDGDAPAVRATIGLGNVDNTSDANKPVSTAAQTALNLKADLASPSFTGVPSAPTAAPGTNTTQLATTAFVAASAVSPFLKEFVSAPQVLTTGGALTIAHGLGAPPKLLQTLLQCETPNVGYSVGDRLPISPFDDNAAVLYGAALTYDATNIYVRFADVARVVPQKSTGTRVVITPGSWRFVVVAWA